MAFHYFTEPIKLTNQNANQAFGVIDINEYRLGNMFTVNPSQTPKAFAITDGQVLVQKIGTENRYNLVLKPNTQPDLGFPKIDYIIYKGISSDSLIAGALVAPATKNDLTRIIHENANAWYNAKKPSQNVPATEPDANRSLGLVYSATASDPNYLKLDAASLNDAFYATNGITLTTVSAGNHIGDFDSSGDIGIVIVFEKIGFKPTFKLARELDSILKVASPVGTTKADLFQIKHKKEDILAYIDSTAFFGAFSTSELMVYNGTTFESKKGDELYTGVISKLFNKNKVYLDIRNEYDDSFNYYENFGNNIKWSLTNTNTLVDIDYYRNFGWPILVINDGQATPEFSAANADKIIKLSFLSTYQTILVYYKKVFKSSLDFNVPNDNFYHNPALVDGRFSVEDLKVPKNVDKAISNYFQLKILTNAISSNAPEPAMPSGFPLKRETYLDNLFPLFDMDIPFDVTSGKSVLKIYYDSNFIDKNYINSSNFTANIGIAKDNSFVTFISFPHKYNLNVKQNKDDKIPVSGMEGTSGSLFLTDLDARVSSIKLAKSKFTIDGTDVPFLKFISEKTSILPDSDTDTETTGITTDNFTFDDVTILALTNAEYAALLQLKNEKFTDGYKVYLGIDRIVTNPDDNGVTYTKFEYCLRGLKNNGSGTIVSERFFPETPIVSYIDVKLNGKAYQRNYEEKVGYDNEEPTTSKKYEDYFIARDNTVQAIVNNFETKLKAIDLKGIHVFKEIKALVKSQSSALWKAAYTYVQANPTQPDDRPLYWARLKLAVMIKNHPYFLGDLDAFSNIVAGSELDSIITLFEENSRNYKGVNFSTAPVGAKKILITGFDPFQLLSDKETQNPSGISALQLHGKTINDALGNVGYIETAIFPVRYFDFDKGVVENLVSQFLENNSVNMIMSLSLNGGKVFFDLERFAGKNRGGFEDNLNVGSGHLSFIQLPSGNEFYETTLPVLKIVTSAATNNFSINGQKLFYDQSYEAENNNKRAHITDDSSQPNTNVDSFLFSEIIEKSIAGSGSNYLSNEIFYRIARKRDDSSSTVKTGHFHLANAKKNPSSWTLIAVLKEVEDSLKRALDGI